MKRAEGDWTPERRTGEEGSTERRALVSLACREVSCLSVSLVCLACTLSVVASLVRRWQAVRVDPIHDVSRNHALRATCSVSGPRHEIQHSPVRICACMEGWVERRSAEAASAHGIGQVQRQSLGGRSCRQLYNDSHQRL